MAEPDPRNWHPLPVAVDDYTLGLDEGVAGLKIAFSPSLGGHRVEPEIAELVVAAIADGRFLILPGPGYEEDYRQRTEQMLTGAIPPNCRFE